MMSSASPARPKAYSYTLSNITTLRRPTDAKPASLCKARFDYSAYKVVLDENKARAIEQAASAQRAAIQREAARAESPHELAERFAAIEEKRKQFETDPASLIRMGERAAMSGDFTYSAGQTDEGQIYVEVIVGSNPE